MKNKQTALEFLQQTYWEQGEIHKFDWEQAEAMQKEQIKEAYIDGCIGEMYEVSATYTAEEYYNKTYANAE